MHDRGSTTRAPSAQGYSPSQTLLTPCERGTHKPKKAPKAPTQAGEKKKPEKGGNKPSCSSSSSAPNNERSTRPHCSVCQKPHSGVCGYNDPTSRFYKGGSRCKPDRAPSSRRDRSRSPSDRRRGYHSDRRSRSPRRRSPSRSYDRDTPPRVSGRGRSYSTSYTTYSRPLPLLSDWITTSLSRAGKTQPSPRQRVERMHTVTKDTNERETRGSYMQRTRHSGRRRARHQPTLPNKRPRALREYFALDSGGYEDYGNGGLRDMETLKRPIEVGTAGPNAAVVRKKGIASFTTIGRFGNAFNWVRPSVDECSKTRTYPSDADFYLSETPNSGASTR